MSYQEFTVAKVKKAFNLITEEKPHIFGDIPAVIGSDLLLQTLAYNLPLAIANKTEKARSEMIIAPILLEARRQLQSQFSLFSGAEFNVDRDRGLNGFCDYIISGSQEQLFVSAPVMMLVEAKNEDMKSGLGQCIAEMYAAQVFNLNEDNAIAAIYGTVTTGTNWQFLKLSGQTVAIDLSEYYVSNQTNINQILGILVNCIRATSPHSIKP